MRSWTEEGWFGPHNGQVDLLPGGRVMVSSGHCDHRDGTGGRDRKAFVAEIDQTTNDVPWRMDFVNHKASLFRAQHVEPCERLHHVGRCPTAE